MHYKKYLCSHCRQSQFFTQTYQPGFRHGKPKGSNYRDYSSNTLTPIRSSHCHSYFSRITKHSSVVTVPFIFSERISVRPNHYELQIFHQCCYQQTHERAERKRITPFPSAVTLLHWVQRRCLTTSDKVVAPKQTPWNAWQEVRELSALPFGEILWAHKMSGIPTLWLQHWFSPEILPNHHTGNTLTIILWRTPISLISFHLAIGVGQLQSDWKVKWTPLCDCLCWTALFCAYPTENSLIKQPNNFVISFLNFCL